jgi:hypothetical protein
MINILLIYNILKLTCLAPNLAIFLNPADFIIIVIDSTSI